MIDLILAELCAFLVFPVIRLHKVLNLRLRGIPEKYLFV